MPIPVRLLRASLQPELDKRLPLPRRDLQWREAILDFAQKNMAQFGRPNLNLTRFSEAIRLSPHTIKRLFADMDGLLGELLRRHLSSISKALGDIPEDAPDRARRQREAYFAVTRKPLGGFTDAHLLLLRDRHLLPEDELTSVTEMRNAIAAILGGPLAQPTMDLLDAPNLSPSQIGFLLEHLPQAPLEAEPPLEPLAPEPASPEPPKTFYLTYPGRTKHKEDPYFLLPVRDQDHARAGP